MLERYEKTCIYAVEGQKQVAIRQVISFLDKWDC